MKRLFVLRHAKSSWDDAHLADFDRPLAERGIKAAPFMGRTMRERGLVPEIVLASPARRALDTARLSAEAAGVDRPVRFDDRIYEASPQTLTRVISELETDLNSAMVVGHNPGVEGLIRFLTGEIVAMPTAALAVVDLQIDDWMDIDHRTGHLVDVLRPKEVGHLT